MNAVETTEDHASSPGHRPVKMRGFHPYPFEGQGVDGMETRRFPLSYCR